jgi:hypothetical protein
MSLPRTPRLDALLDDGDGVLNRPNPVRLVVGDLDVKGFLEHERQLDKGKRIGAEIVDQTRPPFEL